MEKNKLKYCKNCEKEIEAKKNICPQCEEKTVDCKLPKMKNSKLAIFLSLLWAGLGQLYNGEKAKGFITIIVQIILFLLVDSSFNFLIIFPLGLLLWSAHDAYNNAERQNFAIALERKMKN